MTRKVAPATLAFAFALLFVVTGLRGVDFGNQWDEVEWHLQPTRDMVASGVLLPHAYIYPALSKWLVLMPAVPSGVIAALAANGDPHAIQAAMKTALDGADYLLSARRIFVVTSAFTILWVFGAAVALRRPRWEAVVAAASIALSWEFVYQARWVANDCPLTQFAALTLFLLALFHRTRRAAWLYGAAIAVGLGTGAKYPGVILLLPVLGASFLTRLRPSAQGLRLVALSAVAFAAYLVTTPGTLLEPFKFIEDGRRISSAYQGGHFGYSVAPGWPHARIALEYLALSFFSPFKVVSLLVFTAALGGAVTWMRSDRGASAVLVGFPAVFLVFFCCKYNVAIVRNYLFLTPFIAILAARGMGELAARVPHVGARTALGAALVAIALVQAAWLVRAAESIRHFDPPTYARDAFAYVGAHAGTRFRVAPDVRALAAEQHVALPPNVVDAPEGDDVVFFARADGPPPRRWITNDPWLTEAVFGPGELNFNWYSTWDGRDRIVVMTLEKARAAGVALAQ
jgi:4-amino-4-deoxy-L-arabinose transferase-like glycosyltransferase